MSAVAAVRSKALAVPAWVWLVGIVLVSSIVRIALARRIVAPWIMVDELVYSELAKSFAAHGQFVLRGSTSTGYGVVYPLLLAPAWRLFTSIPTAYAAAKAINAVVMSLAAVPAYLLARRVLEPPLALAVAALSVLVPSMLYTGTLMTENVFYPLFLLAALALVAALERPTPLRLVLLLAACGLAYAARAQAIALFAAAATAPVLLALIERRGFVRSLRPFATLYVILGAGVVLALLGTVARGRSPETLLGAYRAATSSTYTVGGVLRYLLYHAGELDLYLGVVPFAALVALWLAPRDVSPSARALAAASFPLVFWLLLEVAAFASQPSVARVEERNMFYVAPLALTALLGLAADGIVPRRRPVVLCAAAIAAILPFFVPYTRLIATSAISDTFGLLPWWWVQDHWITLQQVRYAVLAVAVGAAALYAFLPRRYALVLPALVAAYFVVTSAVVANGRHGIHQASLGSRWAGIRDYHLDWIDRALPAGATVSVLWTGKTEPQVVWENEFFSRRVGPVYDVSPATPPDPLPETTVVRRDDGALTANGKVVRAQYVLADGSVDVSGRVIARDVLIGTNLYRVDGPIVLLTKVTGLYPNDTWSGPNVTYRRVECPGGRLAVQLGSDPSLFRGPQTVVAREGGRVVGRTRFPPAGQGRLVVPLRRRADGTCVVDFAVARTLVPARVMPGSTDPRPLGAHFLTFTFRP